MNWLPSTGVTSVLILLVLATAYGVGRLDWHQMSVMSVNTGALKANGSARLDQLSNS